MRRQSVPRQGRSSSARRAGSSGPRRVAGRGRPRAGTAPSRRRGSRRRRPWLATSSSTAPVRDEVGDRERLGRVDEVETGVRHRARSAGATFAVPMSSPSIDLPRSPEMTVAGVPSAMSASARRIAGSVLLVAVAPATTTSGGAWVTPAYSHDDDGRAFPRADNDHPRRRHGHRRRGRADARRAPPGPRAHRRDDRQRQRPGRHLHRELAARVRPTSGWPCRSTRGVASRSNATTSRSRAPRSRARARSTAATSTSGPRRRRKGDRRGRVPHRDVPRGDRPDHPRPRRAAVERRDGLTREPRLSDRIPELVIMGGAHRYGNVTPRAEFNIWGDPEAARVVISSGVRGSPWCRSMRPTPPSSRWMTAPAAGARYPGRRRRPTFIATDRRIPTTPSRWTTARSAPVHDALCGRGHRRPGRRLGPPGPRRRRDER